MRADVKLRRGMAAIAEKKCGVPGRIPKICLCIKQFLLVDLLSILKEGRYS